MSDNPAMTAGNSAWRAQLDARAVRPPRVPRRPLLLAGVDAAVGSIEPALAQLLRDARLPLRRQGDTEVVDATPDGALARIARWLFEHGLSGAWRNELLAVTDASMQRRAVVERAAVRPLGIATFAIHLVGFAPGGDVWVQQRALDKATDPGQWDTLVGGLVAAHEDDSLALERETWEEAGLRAGALHALARADHLTVRRPLREGYMVEHVKVFEAVIPEGMTPVNQDGEVACFDCIAPGDLLERIAAGAFTLEAALILARCMERRGLVESPSTSG